MNMENILGWGLFFLGFYLMLAGSPEYAGLGVIALLFGNVFMVGGRVSNLEKKVAILSGEDSESN